MRHLPLTVIVDDIEAGHRERVAEVLDESVLDPLHRAMRRQLEALELER